MPFNESLLVFCFSLSQNRTLLGLLWTASWFHTSWKQSGCMNEVSFLTQARSCRPQLLAPLSGILSVSSRGRAMHNGGSSVCFLAVWAQLHHGPWYLFHCFPTASWLPCEASEKGFWNSHHPNYSPSQSNCTASPDWYPGSLLLIKRFTAFKNYHNVKITRLGDLESSLRF